MCIHFIFLVSTKPLASTEVTGPSFRGQKGSHGERKRLHCQHCGNASFGESAKYDSVNQSRCEQQRYPIHKACRSLLESRAIGLQHLIYIAMSTRSTNSNVNSLIMIISEGRSYDYSMPFFVNSATDPHRPLHLPPYASCRKCRDASWSQLCHAVSRGYRMQSSPQNASVTPYRTSPLSFPSLLQSPASHRRCQTVSTPLQQPTTCCSKESWDVVISRHLDKKSSNHGGS